MTEVTEIFADVFMLTGDSEDPRNIDFRFYTQEKGYYDANGQLIEKEFYMQYDPNTDTFSDIAVKSTYVYSTDKNGVVNRRTETIQWLLTDGRVGATKEITVAYA